VQRRKVEADAAIERAEVAEAKNKTYELQILQKDQEITSLQHKLGVLEGELEKAEAKVADAKVAHEHGEAHASTAVNLQRKIDLLEDELDRAEKNVKETMEKLRQVDVKAEHFERQVHRAEQERDTWEKKYEDSLAKYQASQKELEELLRTMDQL